MLLTSEVYILLPSNCLCTNEAHAAEGSSFVAISGSLVLSDVDECEAASHECSQYADCLNMQGAYTCQCRTGYTGNGWQCKGKRPGSSAQR